MVSGGESRFVLNSKFLFDENLSMQAIYIYLVLRTYENKKTHQCFPSYQTIFKRTGLSRKSVYNHLIELESKGYIIKKSLRKGAVLKNTYTLLYDVTRGKFYSVNNAERSREYSVTGNILLINSIYKEGKELHYLQKYILDNCPRVQKLSKQMTYKDCEEIVSSYGIDSAITKLDDMENYKFLNKYISVYRTLRKWIGIDTKTSGTKNVISTDRPL